MKVESEIVVKCQMDLLQEKTQLEAVLLARKRHHSVNILGFQQDGTTTKVPSKFWEGFVIKVTWSAHLRVIRRNAQHSFFVARPNTLSLAFCLMLFAIAAVAPCCNYLYMRLEKFKV